MNRTNACAPAAGLRRASWPRCCGRRARRRGAAGRGRPTCPARPEQLHVPAAEVHAARGPPTTASSWQNGIVAYLAPDRALPLVTVTVLMRVGPDLDPAGKEGLAATDGEPADAQRHARSCTAEQLEERLVVPRRPARVAAWAAAAA